MAIATGLDKCKISENINNEAEPRKHTNLPRNHDNFSEASYFSREEFYTKSMQSPENIQIFLGTTITFQKLPTFLAVNFSYYGLFQAERVVNIVPEIAFLASVYQIFGKIIPNVAFHKINIISSYFS